MSNGVRTQYTLFMYILVKLHIIEIHSFFVELFEKTKVYEVMNTPFLVMYVPGI